MISNNYMKKLIILIIFTAIILSFNLISSSVTHAEQFLCVADLATGFKFNSASKSWENANFNVSSEKFIISKSEIDKQSYKVTLMGEKVEQAVCEEDFNEAGILFCDGFSEYRFNKNNGRYVKVYLIGYYTYTAGSTMFGEDGKNTPHIEIGKCSQF